jgi:alanyl-tRNA synthetase
MTKKIFNENQYQREFDAKVVKIDGNRVILDQTCFFPEGGGQVGDIGTINGINVINTEKKVAEIININGQEIPVGGEIVHVLDSEPNFQINDKIHCEINWERRFKIMRLHGASHIMEHFLIQVFGELSRLGSKVDSKKDRSDYGSEERLDNEKLLQVQDLCNKFILGNHMIKTQFHEENENIKVWICEDIRMNCGGTHVKNTSEIGNIRLKRKNKGSGVERVETYLEE